jgi:hypothetical protein
MLAVINHGTTTAAGAVFSVGPLEDISPAVVAKHLVAALHGHNQDKVVLD